LPVCRLWENGLFRRKGFRGFAFIKHDCRKRVDVGRFILPSLAREPGFPPQFLKVGFPVPALLGRHLREKDSLATPLDHQQAIPADADIFDVQYPAERREDRDFIFQSRKFPGVHRGKARITQRRVSGRIPHAEIKRLLRRNQANAPAQLSFFFERHEHAALLLERRKIAGRRLVQFLFPDGRLHRLLRQLDQGVFFFGTERKRVRLGSAGLCLQQCHRTIAHHAAPVAGHIAGIRILQDLGLVGPQSLGRNHGGHNRTSAACLPYARLEVVGQTEVVPLLDGLQHFVVELRGFVVSVVMREIGAGHNERACPRPLEHFGERKP